MSTQLGAATGAEAAEVGPVTHIAPVQQKDRITTFDALRGFALLGVLVTNMLQAYSFVRTGADEEIATLIHTFAEGTFISMFSFIVRARFRAATAQR